MINLLILFNKLMCGKELHKVLVSLNRICLLHSKKHKYIPPKINSNVINSNDAKNEIKKLINYLEHPHFSYLQK